MVLQMDVFNDLVQLCADTAAVFEHFAQGLKSKNLAFPAVRQPGIVSYKDKFWLIDEHAILHEQLPSNTQSESTIAFTFPTETEDIIMEAVRKTWSIRLKLSSPESSCHAVKIANGYLNFDLEDEEDEKRHGPHWNHVDARNGRRERKQLQASKLATQLAKISDLAWNMGEIVCEETYESLLSLLGVIVHSFKSAKSPYG